MKIRLFTIPNFITCLNLVAGCIGIVHTWILPIEGLHVAMCCMLAAAVFDFLDGFMARLLKSYSDVGVQLDSLADMVSFGVLPAMMVARCAQSMENPAMPMWAWLVAPFILTAFSALRLAKFNIDERQTSEFIGLPTPANALFFGSLSLFCVTYHTAVWPMLALVPVFSFLLVCELPMFSLKLKNFSVRKYAWQIAFVVVAAGIVAAMLLLDIPLLTAAAPIILAYILLSVLKFFPKKFGS